MAKGNEALYSGRNVIMISEVKHYFSVYLKFITTSFTEASSFRLNFILLILMDIFFYLSALATVSFIYDHVQTIGPWNENQLLFFIAFMLAVDHLHMVLISESFWNLSHQINTGGMDFILLRPLSSIFTTFFRYFRASTIINIFVVWGFLIYYGMKLEFGLYNWILLPPLLILAFTLLAIIEFIIATSTFWLTEGLGINFLRMQVQQLSRWPNFIYSSLSRKVLTTAFPILLIGSAPVHFLYDKSQWHYILYLLFAIVISGLCLRFVWSLALKHYDSASS
jgi:ABC-2 type transport system permease protein